MVPEEQTMEISAEAFRLLRNADIPNIGKNRTFAGFVVNTRERRRRRRRDPIQPNFSTDRR
jgi:hypothetical protein